MSSKILLALLLFVLYNEMLIGDSLNVEIINDSIFVQNTGVWENCLFRPKSIVPVEGYNITLTQQDTSNNFAFCNQRSASTFSFNRREAFVAEI